MHRCGSQRQEGRLLLQKLDFIQAEIVRASLAGIKSNAIRTWRQLVSSLATRLPTLQQDQLANGVHHQDHGL